MSVGVLDNQYLLEQVWMELEFRRCKEDRLYWIENYWYIPSDAAEEGRVLFKLWDFQRDIFDAFNENKRVIVAKCRQIGATTLAVADSAHDLLFTEGRADILIMSYTQDAADNNLAMLDHGYRFLPDWMKERLPKRDDDATSKITFKFADGRLTSAKSLVGTASSGAGKSTTRVIVDENALMKNPTSTFRAVDATTLQRIKLAEDNRAVFIALSTPRSNSDMFAQRFWSAWRGESDWKGVFVPAQKNRFLKGYDPLVDDEATFMAAWRARQQDYADKPWEFFQDFGRSPEETFSESGRKRFPHLPDLSECLPFPYAGDVKKRGDKYVLDLVRESEDVGETNDEYDMAPMRFTVEPDSWDRKATYVIAADPATGSGKDYSTFYVGCHSDKEETDVEIVASYSSNTVDPLEFAEILYRVGHYFRGEHQRAALIAPERTSNEVGQIINYLRSKRYPNMYRHKNSVKVRQKPGTEYGWVVTRHSKPEALSALGRMFEHHVEDDGSEWTWSRLAGIDPDFRDELGTYVVNETLTGNLTFGADGGAHDDRVMAAAILCAILEKLPRRGQSLPSGTTDEGDTVTPSPSGYLPTFHTADLLAAEKQKARDLAEAAARERREMERQWQMQSA